jgi:hypothetical protein
MFEIQLSLSHWLRSNHVPLHMFLNSIRHSYFHIIGVQPPSLISIRVAASFDVGGRHCAW